MTKKRLIFLSVVLSVLSVATLMCSFQNVKNSDAAADEGHVLSRLYAGGDITLEDVKNIAALRVGEVRIVSGGACGGDGFKTVSYNVMLPDAPSAAVEAGFVSQVRADYDNVTACEIVRYYGKYGEYHIAEAKIELEDAAFYPLVTGLTVSGVYMGYVSTGGPIVFVAYKES